MDQEAKYYRIKRTKYPESNGLVVKVEKGKLENITGNPEDIIEYNCSLNNEGYLELKSEDFFMKEIEEVEANKLKEDYGNWLLLQGVVSEQDPVNKRAMLPDDSRLRGI